MAGEGVLRGEQHIISHCSIQLRDASNVIYLLITNFLRGGPQEDNQPNDIHVSVELGGIPNK